MRTPHTFPAAADGLPHRILVAFDDSAHAWQALDRAVGLASASGAELTLLTVAQQPRVFASPYATPIPSVDQLLAEAEAELAPVVASLPEGISANGVAIFGDPADEILKEAERGRADLIVMGTRGHSEPITLAIGSVSHSVLRRAPVPVLVVRDVASIAREDRVAERVAAAAQP